MVEKIPAYRVRLFLSVDLTGSTQFKNSNREKNGIRPLWVKIFREFYRNFPARLNDNYIDIANKRRHIVQIEKENGNPKLWKTIGDEIIFCCRLYSQCHLGACIDAFIKTLVEYGDELNKDYELNTKGSAWVASFPVPNVSLNLNKDNIDEDNIDDESIELEIDETPRFFDFLGKGIDAGFRIAKNASINSLTISPGLALLLCKTIRNVDTTKYERHHHLTGMQLLKGVAGNEPYPILMINTEREKGNKEIYNMQNYLSHILGEQDIKKMEEYILAYMEYHEIEVPKLRVAHDIKDFKEPDYYQKYVSELQSKMDEDEGLKDSAKAEEQQAIASNLNDELNNMFQEIKKFIDAIQSKQQPN